MNKTILILGIIFLLIGVSINPSIGINIEKKSINMANEGNTFYVGGSGSGNYTSIQDAINDSSDGDTVFVYGDSSPYFENIIINKSINLIGEDRNTTIIDANMSGNAIYITSDNVNILELTIQNSNIEGIKIEKYFGFCTISDNIITNNKHGINMIYSCNNTIIKDNILLDNELFTIVLSSRCNNNTISHNIIEHSIGTYYYYGIVLFMSNSNNISKNSIDIDDNGISICASEYNIILNNNISSNTDGINIQRSSNNSIIGNNLKYCGNGLTIDDKSSNNKLYHNNFIYNYFNAKDECDNIWDDGKYGNYWSDYKDKYPNAKKKPKEGIWDTPYEIEGGSNKDYRPLIKPWPKSKSKDINSNIYGLNNTSHYMCFVKSGYVSHKNVVCKGLYFTAPINFCIGDVELTLKNFPGEPERTRLFILSLSGNKIYKNNISVSLKGFFGKVCPSGSIYSGELTGFAMIANITPL